MNLREKLEGIKDSMDIFYEPVVAVMQIFLIFIIAAILIKIGSYIIRRIFEKQKKSEYKYKLDDKRLDTLNTLSVSIYKYMIYILAAVAVLSKLTQAFNLQSVMAAAGIGGVALGLGAQSLIKDIISGFFILLEDQYAVGDRITVDTMTGIVEKVELRVTKIRDFNGDLYIIPNGEITKTTNHVRGNKAVIVDIPVAYSANIDKAMEAAERVCTMVTDEFDTIVDKPAVLGITGLGNENLTLRIFAYALPNQQWAVERRIRKMIKDEFDKEKIEFYDRMKIINMQ